MMNFRKLLAKRLSYLPELRMEVLQNHLNYIQYLATDYNSRTERELYLMTALKRHQQQAPLSYSAEHYLQTSQRLIQQLEEAAKYALEQKRQDTALAFLEQYTQQIESFGIPWKKIANYNTPEARIVAEGYDDFTEMALLKLHLVTQEYLSKHYPLLYEQTLSPKQRMAAIQGI